MKQSPDLQAAQVAMAPGKITLDGFLGTDPRNLVDILIADNASVERAGFDHADLADRMEQLRDAGSRGLGDFITVEDVFEVKVESVRGKLPCPFGDQAFIPKVNTTVRRKKDGGTLVFSDLHIHMIRSHGFYEGKGCPFRLEPSEIISVLQISPDTSE